LAIGGFAPVKSACILALLAATGLVADEAYAKPVSGNVPLPRPRPAAIKALAKAQAHSRSGAPIALLPAVHAFAPGTIPPRESGALAASVIPATAPDSSPGPSPGPSSLFAPAPANVGSVPPPAARSAPLAFASTAVTSAIDLSAVKRAIELARRGHADEATDVESSISDPVARKLAEWAILRSDDSGATFSRYAAFIAANPSWPSIVTLRRRAEAMLWHERPDPATVMRFFASDSPRTAKGHFALARALLAQGNAPAAQSVVGEAWRTEGFSGDLEAQARSAFGELITGADDKARMDARLYVEDEEGAMRAAQHLNATEIAIARARSAVINKSAKAKALLEDVPSSARHDAGYMFSRIQWLRRSDKIAEAGRLMLEVPHDPAKLHDLDQWWIERRLIARKLLDIGEIKAAYQVARDASPPPNENYRAEHEFTAGWIAMRFLHEPSAALAHFARIGIGISNPITLARASYWQGRAAEAMGHERDARAHYDAAARYPTAYYGQLARARLGLGEFALHNSPATGAERRGLEVARALEILYAIDARDLVAPMVADLADKASDPSALATLAEITTHHQDARSTLLLGKIALARGLPMDHFAFPAFGVPKYAQIGPEVEPCVVYSIVRQESAFNARVVSSAHALGLMQVTPAAGRYVAKKYNVTFNQQRLLNDTVYNAQIGTAELGGVISDYRGSYILAFASYNAGRGRVNEWLGKYGDPRDPKVDPIDWIERIPFSETRNYVQRVLENMQVYRARFGGGSRLMIEADLHRGGHSE
jgi:soluble lytic murein transglycosylase